MMFADLTITTAMMMTAAPTVAPRQLPRVCFTICGESETPLPETFRPLWQSLGTVGLVGDQSVASSLASLVAWRQVAESLPADEAAEAFVSRLLVANRPNPTRKTRLAPRAR